MTSSAPSAPAPKPTIDWQNPLTQAIVLTTLTLVGTVGGFIAQANGQTTWSYALWGLAFLTGGIPAAIEAIQTLWHERKLDVDLLMVVAALGAASVGQAGDGAILLFLFSLSNTLQDWAMGRTKRAIEALMDLNPEGATVLQPDGSEVFRPLEAIQPGDTLLVRPGERFAADAQIIDGYSDVDESAITGESVPVDKKPGDPVRSGTLNGHGVLRVAVERPASESTLAKLVGLVESARAAKSGTERFAERFEGPYTIAVLLSAPVVFLLAHYVFGLEAGAAWYRAMTFLVVASPCAVVIATPAAVLSAMAAAARAGVLFKSGAALEALAKARIVAFDKTGTLTQGQMQLVKLVPLQGSEENLHRLAASLERFSEHPFAKAVTDSYSQGLLEVEEMRGIRGKGAVGKLSESGQTLWVGNRALVADQGATLSPEAQQQLAALEAEGLTTAVLGLDQSAVGLLAVADVARPEAAQAVQALKAQGVRVVMLTGDRQAVAQHIAKELGVSEVRAELMPEDKLKVIEALERENRVVMVGDGVNDAPALNAASVGVSMAAGSDVSLESADLVLMRNDLRGLVGAMKLAKATARTVMFNLSFALFIIVVVGSLALLGKVPLPHGVIAHEGGTVFVVLVGLRLLAYRLGI